jgi:hypothetical protein
MPPTDLVGFLQRTGGGLNRFGNGRSGVLREADARRVARAGAAASCDGPVAAGGVFRDVGQFEIILRRVGAVDEMVAGERP